MRYLFIAFIYFLLSSCETKYKMYINYQDGSKDTTIVNSTGIPTLSDGCIYFGMHDGPAYSCGVKTFTYKTLENESK